MFALLGSLMSGPFLEIQNRQTMPEKLREDHQVSGEAGRIADQEVTLVVDQDHPWTQGEGTGLNWLDSLMAGDILVQTRQIMSEK